MENLRISDNSLDTKQQSNYKKLLPLRTNNNRIQSNTLLDQNLSSTMMPATNVTNEQMTTMMAPKLPPKPIREQARVLFPYNAQNDDELTIKEGDIITIISKENEDVGWWKGELNGRIALFPDNFVEIIKQPPQQPATLTNTNTNTISSSGTTETETKLNRVKKPDRVNSNSSNITGTGTIEQVSISSINKTMAKTSSNNNSTTTTATSKAIEMDENQMNTGIGSNKDDNNGFSNKNNNINNTTTTNSIIDESNNSKLVHLTAQRPKIPANTRRPPSIYFQKDLEINDNLSENGFDNIQDSPESNEITECNDQRSPIATSSGLKTSTALSTEKMLPWVVELKKAQEAKRERKENNELNINNKNETSLSTVANKSSYNANSNPQAITTNKPFVPKSNKPSNLSQNINECLNENNLPGMYKVPTLRSNTLNNNTYVKSTMSDQFKSSGSNSLSTSKKQQEQELKGEINDLRAKLNDIEQKMKQQQYIMEKMQVTIKEFIEEKRKSNAVVKELINELAEEKKKIASIQIDLDCLRKLNNTAI